MAQKLKNPKDTQESRFEGNGVEFRGKMIGYEEIDDSRGDKLCAEALIRLKNQVKAVGAHKPKIIINITKEGVKLTDVITKEVTYNHAVQRISFISRDTTDNRAFGYIYSEMNGQHKFYAIKTALSAEMLVLTLRDLFTSVYKGKQNGEEGAAETATDETATENTENMSEVPAMFSDSLIDVVAADTLESEYSVPPSNAPVVTTTVDGEIPKLTGPAKVNRSNFLDLGAEPEEKPITSVLDDFDAMFDRLHTPSATFTDKPQPNGDRPSSDLLQLSSPTTALAEPPLANPFSLPPTVPYVSRTTSLPASNYTGFGPSLPRPPPAASQAPFSPKNFSSSLPTQTPFPPATHSMFPQSFPNQQTSTPNAFAANLFSVHSSKSPFDDPFFNQSNQSPAPAATGPWGAGVPVPNNATQVHPGFQAAGSPINPFLSPTSSNVASLQPVVQEAKRADGTKVARPTRISKDVLFKDLVPMTKQDAPFKTPKEMFTDLGNAPKKSLIELQFDAKSDYINAEGGSAPPQSALQDPFGFSMFGPASSKAATEEPVYTNVQKQPRHPAELL